ncbi:uncharacterized protein MKZ38_001721 [Zalerion maritima]|uniref:Uncharacterized protein n=1 Tax=Zalerion maritima TaxID=339359 RepID=A0AAD5WLJ5_9PEZI|nr:uncharacterized protein MKZ38_001721 [Zalerion maritima]
MLTAPPGQPTSTDLSPLNNRNDINNDADDQGGLSFVGPAFRGGSNLTLYGTPESIYSQLLSINPNYDADMQDLEPVDGSSTPADAPEGGFVRGDQDRWPILHCNHARRADYKRVKQGIKYLRKIKGECYLPAKRCARLSCSWESAIWWCSNLDKKQSNQCRWIGDHAEWPNEICPCHKDAGKNSCYLSGVYDETYFLGDGSLEHPVANIKVEWDDCKKNPTNKDNK